MTKTLIFSTILSCVLAVAAIAQEPDLFPVDKHGKAGYIDHTGKIVIPLKFDDAWPFSEGLAPVRIGEDWGYIDKTGRVVIKPQFFSARNFSQGFSEVGIYWEGRRIIDSTIGYYSLIDKSGRVITDHRLDVISGFSDGLARVRTKDDKDSYVDATGKIVLDNDAYSAFDFHNGRARFEIGYGPDSKTGYIDRSGRPVIPATFEGGEDFSEGLACVFNDRKAGFIDVDGKIVIPLQYRSCGDFSEGLAAVLVNGNVGFIDPFGAMVIQPKFAWNPGDVSRFSEGVAVVKVGESEMPTREGLRDVTIASDHSILSNSNGMFGVIDKAGKFIIPPKYVQIGDFHNGLAWVNLSDAYIIHGSTDRWGYINKAGKIVWKSV